MDVKTAWSVINISKKGFSFYGKVKDCEHAKITKMLNLVKNVYQNRSNTTVTAEL